MILSDIVNLDLLLVYSAFIASELNLRTNTAGFQESCSLHYDVHMESFAEPTS